MDTTFLGTPDWLCWFFYLVWNGSQRLILQDFISCGYGRRRWRCYVCGSVL